MSRPPRARKLPEALGLWRGTNPVSRPSARELFATAFASLSADATSVSPTSNANTSPRPQIFASNGEVIEPLDAVEVVEHEADALPQTNRAQELTNNDDHVGQGQDSSNSAGILRHETSTPGELLSVDQIPLSVDQIPPRPVRRGQPRKLDDFAKGRLLGLMSQGLSFRQSAAQLGVHHVTLLNTLKRDEEFAQQVSEARLDAISQPLFTVVKASRINWRAAAWLAKFLEERRGRIYETTPEERELEKVRAR